MNRREFLLSGGSAVLAGSAADGSPFRLEGGPPMTPAINPIHLTGKHTDWPLAELAALGYRGLELTPSCLEAPEGWQSAAAKAGMSPLCVNALEDLRPYLTGSLTDLVVWRRSATLDHLRKTLQRMQSLKIPFLIVAPSRLAENYQTPAEARALLIDSLRQLATAGETTTILLMAAPFRLFDSAHEIAAIVDEAAHPNIAAGLDVGHAALAGENPAEAAGILGARLRYVGIHDAEVRPGIPRLDRHLPLGEGTLHRADIQAAIGRNPWSVCVTAPDRPLDAARSALAWLTRVG